MSKTKKNKPNYLSLLYLFKLGQSPYIILLFLLILARIFLIYQNFSDHALASFSDLFGYLDNQNSWSGLDNFIHFKSFFKDYYYEYGWFFLAIQSIGYLFFKANYFAVLISGFIFLPVLGILVNFIIAKNVLKKKPLILIYLFFTLLMATDFQYISIRHLMAELSLAIFILFLSKKKWIILFISGLIAGLSVLTALEYGVALNIAILPILLISYFSFLKRNRRLFLFYLGEMLILALFILWLELKGALGNYLDFYSGFMNNFYHASPCALDKFPRFSQLHDLKSTSNLLIFNIPVEFLQRLNFYIIPVFYIVVIFLVLLFFINEKMFKVNNLIKLVLSLYGLLIFIRTLDTPCIGYFSYGLVPFLIVLTILIGESFRRLKEINNKRNNLIITTLIIISFLWLLVTENTGYLVKIFGKKIPVVEKVNYEKIYYPPAGWFFKKDLVKGYQEVTNFIVKNTDNNDFLYVYPNGPYNILTNRKSPVGISNMVHFIFAGEKIQNIALGELEKNKPKYVVINYRNGINAYYGQNTNNDPALYSLTAEEGPVFPGYGNKIEKYILENYKSAYKNSLAIIMEKRNIPVKLISDNSPILSINNFNNEKIILQAMINQSQGKIYAINAEKASWEIILDHSVTASNISLRLKLDGDIITKHLSRYLLNFYLNNSNKPVKIELAHKDWQIVNIPIYDKMQIINIKIEVGQNNGFVWWLNPKSLEIDNITFTK